jgi:hypothetical protein
MYTFSMEVSVPPPKLNSNYVACYINTNCVILECEGNKEETCHLPNVEDFLGTQFMMKSL